MTDARKATDQETRARNIIKRLKMFNRKERDRLIKHALCEKPESPQISTAFWKQISNGGTRPEAGAMFIGMDYHLNWLYAALATSELEGKALNEKLRNEWTCKTQVDEEHKDYRPIQNNQEDVDLLIAWFDQRWAKPLRLVLIEAKLDSGWSSEQFESKLDRLTLIRNDSIEWSLDFMDWQFVLMSPDEPPPDSFSAFLDEDRYRWARQRDSGEYKFRYKELSRPKKNAKVNRVPGDWNYWRISG